jgi:hypothetical protein
MNGTAENHSAASAANKEQIDNGELWRVAFSLAGGLGSLIRSHQSSLKIPASLQRQAESLIRSLAGCDALRWLTEEEAVSLW